ncbi:hypothetical protein ACFLYQ_03635 [Chloroflexota bacterium]
MLDSIINTIIGAVVVYLLSFGGRYLDRYLKNRFPSLADRASVKSTSKSIRSGEKTATTPSESDPNSPPEAEPKPVTSAIRPTFGRIKLDDLRAHEEEYSFYGDYKWWLSSVLIIGIGIGMAFLANWIFYSILDIFSYDTPYIEGAPLALVIVGIIWGITYIVSGTSIIEAWYEVFFGMTEPYGDIFDSFWTTLFVALPFNIFIAWGIANGLAIAAALFLDTGYELVTFIALGIITFLQLSVMNEEYLYL